MPLVKKQLIVPYSAQQMFDLVDQVEQYPDFMPWCGGTKVQRPSEHEVIAQVMIKLGAVSQGFTTKNHQCRPSEIKLHLADGPFESLEGSWKFKALSEQACKIHFELQYVFASRLLGLAIAPIFDQIARGFVDAFVTEAEKRYGT